MYLSGLFAFSALLFRLLFLVQRSLCVSCGKRCQTSRPDSSGSNRECCCHACGHAGPAAFPPRSTASGIASHAGSPSLSKAPPLLRKKSGRTQAPAAQAVPERRLHSADKKARPGRHGLFFSQAHCLHIMHRRVPLQVSDAPPFSLQRTPASLYNGVIRLSVRRRASPSGKTHDDNKPAFLVAASLEVPDSAACLFLHGRQHPRPRVMDSARTSCSVRFPAEKNPCRYESLFSDLLSPQVGEAAYIFLP